ncbi:MAG: hypothetical protein IJR59_07355 [Firmicutes bacterium]|nr:hypothetical protein [Bacillota bacterium]
MNLLSSADQYLSFLNQYGYRSTQEESEFCTSYIGNDNKVIIIYTQYSYEIICYFEDNTTLKSFSLQDALKYCSINNLKGIYQISNNNDLKKGLIYIANVIKKVYMDADISNPHIFNAIYDYVSKEREQALNEYYIQEELKKADNYWNNNNISEAYKIYLKNIEYLSLSQIKKLYISGFNVDSTKADSVLKSRVNK